MPKATQQPAAGDLSEAVENRGCDSPPTKETSTLTAKLNHQGTANYYTAAGTLTELSHLLEVHRRKPNSAKHDRSYAISRTALLPALLDCTK
jgi:hypothetical protein